MSPPPNVLPSKHLPTVSLPSNGAEVAPEGDKALGQNVEITVEQSCPPSISEDKDMEGVPAPTPIEGESERLRSSLSCDEGEKKMSEQFECNQESNLAHSRMEGDRESSNEQQKEQSISNSRSRRARYQSSAQKEKSTAKSDADQSPSRPRRPPKSEKGELTLEQKLQVSPQPLDLDSEKHRDLT